MTISGEQLSINYMYRAGCENDTQRAETADSEAEGGVGWGGVSAQ